MEQQLRQAFHNCTSQIKNERQQGESLINRFQKELQYPLLLLNYIKNEQNVEFQVRASIEFKIFCSKYSQESDYENQSYQQVIQQIKFIIVPLMLQVETKVFIQLLQSFQKLCLKEFPYKWPTLIKEIVQLSNQTQDYFRCLKIVRYIVQRYEFESRSDPLYEEIILVCDDMHDQLFFIIENVLQNIQSSSNEQQTQVLGKVLKQGLKIFYFLNYHDLHPKFEDNLNNWMGVLVKALRVNIPNFIGFKCKGEAMRSILLYSRKYREDIQDLIQDFSQEIWQVCTNTTNEEQFDKIVINALKYFKDILCWDKMMPFFGSNIENLMQSLVLPNMNLNQNDIELFKDEPEVFISQFFELSDIVSRRYQSVQLLKMLFKFYNAQTVQFLQNYLQNYVNQQQQQKNLQVEIIIINLLIDGGQMAFRPNEGITQISLQQDFIIYYWKQVIWPYFTNILNEISSNKINNIHLFFNLRFVFFYRLYIQKDEIEQLISIFTQLLNLQNETIQKSACYCLEALITVSEKLQTQYYGPKTYYFTNQKIALLAGGLFQQLFIYIQKNELEPYSLKLIFVIVKMLQNQVNQFLQFLLPLYQHLIVKVSNYPFNCQYLVYEGLGYLTQNLESTNIQNYSEQILPELTQKIGSQTELVSLSLQILSILIKTHSNLPQSMQLIYESILHHQLWTEDNYNNFTSMCMFLENYIGKFPNKMNEDNQKIIGLINYLASNMYYQVLFEFSKNLVTQISLQNSLNCGFLNLILEIFKQNYQQLQLNDSQGKKVELIRSFFDFFSTLVLRQNPTNTIQIVNNNNKKFESVSSGLIQTLLSQEIQYIQQLQGRQRKLVFNALTLILFNEKQFLDISLWANLIKSIVTNISTKNYKLGMQALEEQASVRYVTCLAQIQVKNYFQLIIYQKENQIVFQNEELFFAKSFQEFIIQNKDSINVAQILTQDQQKTLFNLIQRYSK